MTTDQNILIALGKAISPNVSMWYGQGAVLQVEFARLLTYPYSFFVSFPVKTPDGDLTLLAKIHRKPHMLTLTDALSSDSLKAAGHDEYEMTRKIWNVFEAEGSPAFTAVQPLAFLEEWNAILMKKVDGDALKMHLITLSMALRNRKSLAQLQKYLSAAAVWLRTFHNRVAEEREEPFPVQDAIDTMTYVLTRLGSHIDITNYRVALTKKMHEISSLQVPVALLHDDFQYSNILVEKNGRVCVLDYALNHRSCVYSDLATLLIDPRTRGVQIWSGGLLIPQRFIQHLDQTILDTYFMGKPYNKPVLEFFCALAILNKWSADEDELSSSQGIKTKSIFSQHLRRYYVNLLVKYI